MKRVIPGVLVMLLLFAFAMPVAAAEGDSSSAFDAVAAKLADPFIDELPEDTTFDSCSFYYGASEQDHAYIEYDRSEDRITIGTMQYYKNVLMHTSIEIPRGFDPKGATYDIRVFYHYEFDNYESDVDVLETAVYAPLYTFAGTERFVGDYTGASDNQDFLETAANISVADALYGADLIMDRLLSLDCTVADFGFAEFEQEATRQSFPFRRFVDVKFNQYFYQPVYWAVAAKVTAGTDGNRFWPTFSPDAPCTRAQCVAFLYRAAGEPPFQYTKNPFLDVGNGGEWYSDAVAWAVAEGITAGTDKDHFSPNDPCTRAQIVTFLYRAAGKPAFQYTDNPFIDVGNGGEWYSDAVAWAVAEGITSGTDKEHFSPNRTCTRGQIVSFLYRYMGTSAASK